MDDVHRQIDAGEVLEVWRQYLPPFLSFRENPSGWGEGVESALSSGVRVKGSRNTRNGDLI